MTNNPTYNPESTIRTSGKEAQRNNILAARIVSDVVKTTLGPKGMDKMLVDSTGNIIVTNDGVTILDEMELDHPAARMIAEIAKTQESEVGDGTTTAVLLAGKLLENAEFLLEKRIHPTLIINGYRLAAEKALEILKSQAHQLDSKKILKQIAMTAMTGKAAEGSKEILANLIVSAVDQVASIDGVSPEDISFEKRKGDSISESELIKGVVLQKEKAHTDMPSIVKEEKILLIDFPLELKVPEAETKLTLNSPEQIENFIASEERKLKGMTEIIIASGAKAIFCQKGIDDVAQYYLAQSGILAFRRTQRSDMERISKATSGKIISAIADVSEKTLGFASKIEEVRQGDESFTYVSGSEEARSVTILIRGGTPHIMDELERALKDGLGDVVSAVKSGFVVSGGGAIEIEISQQLQQYASTISTREQLAIRGFAKALDSIPETLAENAGLDPIDILAQLKKQHESGENRSGINLFTDKIEDTFSAGIIEPLKVKTQAILSASEVAIMILRIDDILISKPLSEKTLPNPYSEFE